MRNCTCVNYRKRRTQCNNWLEEVSAIPTKMVKFTNEFSWKWRASECNVCKILIWGKQNRESNKKLKSVRVYADLNIQMFTKFVRNGQKQKQTAQPEDSAEGRSLNDRQWKRLTQFSSALRMQPCARVCLCVAGFRGISQTPAWRHFFLLNVCCWFLIFFLESPVFTATCGTLVHVVVAIVSSFDLQKQYRPHIKSVLPKIMNCAFMATK